jgi:polyadenylate-binding protein
MAAPSQFASLYVGDLAPDVTEAMLYEIFNAVGPVGSIRVCRDSVNRRSLGYAYVNYHYVGDAERALDTLNYSQIKGRSCRLMWSQRDPSIRKSGAGNIYVTNLDENIDNKALFDTFSLFGNILSCKVACDKEGKSKGHGFVQFETEESQKDAIERVNGMKVGDKFVEVHEFKKREETEKAQQPKEKETKNLYIKSFPKEWDENKLKEVFGVFGELSAVALKSDWQGRPFAFVDFAELEAAKKCIEELHLKEMRSDEDKQSDEESGKEMPTDQDGHPLHLLYVGRFQSKAERWKQAGGKSAGKGKKAAGKGKTSGWGNPKGAPPAPFPGGYPGQMPFNMMPPSMMPLDTAKGGKPMLVPPQMMMAMMGKGAPTMGKGFPMNMRPPAQPRPPMNMQPPVGPQLTAAALSSAPPAMQKQLIGERLFKQISRHRPDLAGKLTGMMLEMSNAELLMLLESEQRLLIKIDQAMEVLQKQQ